MALVFTDAQALGAHLQRSTAHGSIVGIDGWTGVGKTTLARTLANALHGSCYDLDSALAKDRKCYLSALRFSEIADALANPVGVLFVSGICLRQVLEQVGCTADAHIYVKCMAAWGWADEDELNGGFLNGIRGSTGGEATRLEMRLYHERWQPHCNADIEFHRGD